VARCRMGPDKIGVSHSDGPGRPPCLGRWILSRILPVPLKPTASGDFEELYRRILAKDGAGKAAAWYWRQVLRSIPHFVFTEIHWRITMIRNYLKLTLRNMRRRPGFTVVNIGGLSVGLACSILAIFFIRDEYSFDRFHTHIGRIYEVKSKIWRDASSPISLETQGPVGPTLAADYPEVEAATRLAKLDVVVQAGEKVFLQNGLGADPSFFSVFSFPLTRGDAASALGTPDSVVLSKNTARLCFGSSDPMGQTIFIKIKNDTAPYKVAGIAEEIPANSSLTFDVLLPILRVKGPMIDQWKVEAGDAAVDASCFIRLREGADAESLAAKFPDALDKHLVMGAYEGSHYLFPFAEYHRGIRDYSFSSILKPRSSPVYSYLLTSIALLVLLIAGFNFMNLSVGTAAAERIKEIGMRKVLGAEQKNLFNQFRIEGIVMSLAALAAGVGIASVVLPIFNRFSGKGLRLDLLGPGLPLVALVLLAVLLGAAAGSYPGWFLSRLRPSDLFRGNFLLARRRGFSRVLLLVQFGISIFLIITTGFLYRQHRYLLQANLGYDASRVVVLDLRQLTPQFQSASRFLPVLKSRLLTHPEIKSVSAVYSGLASWSARFVKGVESQKTEVIRSNEVDPDFLDALGLQLSEGRWFSADHPSDGTDAVVVNETFARTFTPSQPVGKALSEIFGNKASAKIIGVVRDFHYESLRQTIQPAMISLGAEHVQWAYIRLDGRNLHQALDMIEKEFKALSPGHPFVFSFLDEDVARQYEKEARWSLMISIVSLFAVLIACSGVFALAFQSSVRRTKEIGIRKVLGASIPQIIGLLGGEFVRMAAAASLLAWPVAFFAVHRVLAGYPYRIALGPWTFVAGGATVAVLTLVTVSLQAVRAAKMNTVDNLRHE
jgi:putative ABC transport system permease protein